jgi:hypothetical protein
MYIYMHVRTYIVELYDGGDGNGAVPVEVGEGQGQLELA